jgi:ligand-binding sensor domain-containing protein
MLNFKVLRFICIFYLLLETNTLLSQSPNFKHFTVEDGLPSSKCYQVLQDKKGYIWIASDKGVARYNGYHFQTNYLK